MDEHGRIVHVNISSGDLERSQRFYGAVFSWEFTPNADEYVLFSDCGGIGGGLTTRAEPSATSVLFFVSVRSISEALEAIEQAGGSVELEKTRVGGPGYYAIFRDPDGNRVGLYSET